MHSQSHKLVMNLNVHFLKSIHLNLDFARSINLKFKKMKGSHPASNTSLRAGLLVY